jgi:hypothetical protein
MTRRKRDHPLPVRRTRTFILRIWAEYLEQRPPAWRGEIEETSTHKVTRFNSAEALLTCIRHDIQDAETQAPSETHQDTD